MKNSITSVIDFFYPPFKRIMPIQTFRYAACGGGNMVLGFLVFSVLYYLITNLSHFHLGIIDFDISTVKIGNANVVMMQSKVIAFKAHSFALACSSTVVFVVGFLLNKYVVFTSSNLRGRIQLFRYLLATLSSFCINYFLLNALVLYLHMYPVLAQIIVTAVVVTISFFMQQYFTFKVKEQIVDPN